MGIRLRQEKKKIAKIIELDPQRTWSAVRIKKGNSDSVERNNHVEQSPIYASGGGQMVGGNQQNGDNCERGFISQNVGHAGIDGASGRSTATGSGERGSSGETSSEVSSDMFRGFTAAQRDRWGQADHVRWLERELAESQREREWRERERPRYLSENWK